jgi:hypothetical protein
LHFGLQFGFRFSCWTFVLDRLEQQGLIERQPHPTDRRAKQIVLTPAGRRYRTNVLEQLSAHSPLAPLTAAQQESLRGLLQTLVAQRFERPRPDSGGRPPQSGTGRPFVWPASLAERSPSR